MPPAGRFETGELIFVRPRFDPSAALDNAILATGAATIDWLRTRGVAVPSNETVVHVALAVHDAASDELSFVEATPPAVRLTRAAAFFAAWGNGSAFYHGRLRDPRVRALGVRAADLALRQLGRPYADDFQPPPRRFYCSSLVDYAYWRAAAEHVFVDEPFPLIFEPPDFWEEYYRAQNLTLPVNATGSNPTLLLHSEHVEFGQVAFGQVAFGQVAFGQVAFGQVAFGQVAFGQVDAHDMGAPPRAA